MHLLNCNLGIFLPEWKCKQLRKDGAEIIKEVISSNFIQDMQDLVTPFGFDIKHSLVTIKRKNGKVTTELIAGDIFAYKTFSRIFEPVLCAKLPPIKHKRYQFSFDPMQELIPCSLDSGTVRSVHFSVSRSLREYKFLPACQLKDRQDVEKALRRSFSYLPSQHQGGYFPFQSRCNGTVEYLASPFHFSKFRRSPWPGSITWYPFMMNSQTQRKTHRIPLCRLTPDHLATKSDSELYLQAGINRNWPDARGIYVSKDKNTIISVNRDCHLGICHSKQGGNVSTGFIEFCEVYRGIHRGLQRDNLHFAYDNKYGFVTWDTSRIGGAITVAAKMRVPNLEKHDKFAALLMECGFKCKKLDNDDGCIEVRVCGEYGMTESEIMTGFSYGLKRMARLEWEIEDGVLNDLDMPSEYSKMKAKKHLDTIFD